MPASGTTFLLGQTIIEPGIGYRVYNAGVTPLVGIPQGVVAQAVRALWGPILTPVAIQSLQQIDDVYGVGGSTDDLREAIRGGAQTLQVIRVGTGGVAATVTLTLDGTIAGVILTARYVGTRGNDFRATVRDSLVDATKRELILTEGTTQRQVFTFDKAPTTVGGHGEAGALVAAINAANSLWVTATVATVPAIPGDASVLADVTSAPLITGADPTVTGADYTAALSLLELIDFNVLAIDTDDQAVAATVQTWVDRVRNTGKRIIAVLGEPPSITLATRQADAQAYNDYAIVYVGNGFRTAYDVSIVGHKAAARVAAMIAGSDLTASLTHAVIRGATDVVGPLGVPDMRTSLQKGVLLFGKNAAGQVHIIYGINTYITPDSNHDIGWGKIRRTRTRDAVLDRIAMTWDPMIGQVNNSPIGRAALAGAAQRVVNQMVAQGMLQAGLITEDPSNPPAGDSCWFTTVIDDLDSAEHVYLTVGFRFAPL